MAVVEFIMVFPLLIVAVLGVVQVGIVAAANSAVEEAARAAAHASRNGASPQTAADRAAGGSVSSVQVWRSGGAHEWTARGRVRAVLPGVDYSIEKSAEMP